MYQRLLVPIDGGPISDAGLDEAIKLARATGGRVCLLHVVGDLPLSINDRGYGAVSGEVRQNAENRAEKIVATARARVEHGGVAVDVVMLDGSADHLVEHVVDQVGRWGADLIVLGTHGRSGLGRLLLGSHAEKVLRAATVPVLLVRAREPKKVDETVVSSGGLPAAPIH